MTPRPAGTYWTGRLRPVPATKVPLAIVGVVVLGLALPVGLGETHPVGGRAVPSPGGLLSGGGLPMAAAVHPTARPSGSNGNLGPELASLPRNVASSPVEPVNFTETGLPPGTSWYVTFNGTPQTSTGRSIVFSATAGTYSATVEDPVPYLTQVEYETGTAFFTVNVSNAPVRVSVPYVAYYFLQTEVVPPLPAFVVPSSGWFPSGAPVNVTATCGSYCEFSHWQGTGPGSYSGTANPAPVVMSGPVNETAFVTPRYVVSVSLNGVPPLTNWSVNLGGAIVSAEGSATAQFFETNGTYSFVMSPIPGYTLTPSRGNLTVNGQDVAVQISASSGRPSGQSGIPAWAAYALAAGASAGVVALLTVKYLMRKPGRPFAHGPPVKPRPPAAPP